MNTVDDAAYMDGAAAFSRGDTLRSVVERIGRANDQPYDRDRETKDMSFALGFADEALQLIRRALR